MKLRVGTYITDRLPQKTHTPLIVYSIAGNYCWYKQGTWKKAHSPVNDVLDFLKNHKFRYISFEEYTKLLKP